jgi:hypothetical protein
MQYFLGNDFDIGHKNRYYSPNMQILQLIFHFSPLKTLFSTFFIDETDGIHIRLFRIATVMQRRL